jgi:hypothetical protein
LLDVSESRLNQRKQAPAFSAIIRVHPRSGQDSLPISCT